MKVLLQLSGHQPIFFLLTEDGSQMYKDIYSS